MTTPEGKEKKRVRGFLDSIGAFHFGPYMGGYGRAGIGDEVACINGTFWMCEVKAPDKEPTKLQELCMQRVQNAGGMVTWGTADEIIEDIQAWLNAAPPADGQ